ncbi:MAG: glycosyltransferase [Verrucomicrobiota bacterium]
MKISVILPTYSPNPVRLSATLQALESQDMPVEDWELLVIDNCSTPPLSREALQREFSGALRLIREETPGLSQARLRGIQEATSEILVFCDDDNLLAPNYLSVAFSTLKKNPGVGIAGGRSLPAYAVEPPSWYEEGIAPLGCRDLGDTPLVFTANEFDQNPQYPEMAPIGAGMVFRRRAVGSWARSISRTGISDRKGNSLSSAGDCDMVLHALSDGWDVAYWPDLVLNHLLPKERLTKRYLGAISRAAFRDFVTVLSHHGIRPWRPVSRPTLPLRKLRALVRHRPWTSERSYIAWQSALGNFDGRLRVHDENSNPSSSANEC